MLTRILASSVRTIPWTLGSPFLSFFYYGGILCACDGLLCAFPLHGTVRFGTARYGTAQFGLVAFPPQFSTAIEWAGLFTRRYNCAASTAVTSS